MTNTTCDNCGREITDEVGVVLICPYCGFEPRVSRAEFVLPRHVLDSIAEYEQTKGVER